jgi:hypothetical protein
MPCSPRLVLRVIPRNARNLFFLPFLGLAVCLFCSPALCQVQTGTPPFGSFGGGPDVINNANLNAHLTIPIVHKLGRGHKL